MGTRRTLDRTHSAASSILICVHAEFAPFPRRLSPHRSFHATIALMGVLHAHNHWLLRCCRHSGGCSFADLLLLTYAHSGINMTDAEVKKTIGKPLRQQYKEIGEQHQIPCDESVVESWAQAHFEHQINHWEGNVVLYPGVKEALEVLKNKVCL